MKFGFRKFNLEKRIKSRTTGKIKRKIKKTYTPFYGKKGVGWIKDPKKALYNKIYNKTTVSPFDLVMKALSKKPKRKLTKEEKLQIKLYKKLHKKQRQIEIIENASKKQEEFKESILNLKKQWRETPKHNKIIGFLNLSIILLFFILIIALMP